MPCCAGVDEVVRLKEDAGLDVVSDGEMSKISYATYIRHRLTGFEGDSARPTPQDLDDYPPFRDRLVARAFGQIPAAGLQRADRCQGLRAAREVTSGV